MAERERERKDEGGRSKRDIAGMERRKLATCVPWKGKGSMG